MTTSKLSQTLMEAGFIMRGGFHPKAEDEVPNQWGTINTLIMVGNIGDEMWKAFSMSPEYRAREKYENPLDIWTKRSLHTIAVTFNAKVILSSDGPPYFPFQRWAQRADTVFPSPIGLLIHPEFGLWHAYRGAFLFQEKLCLSIKADTPSPCDSCLDRPCLTSCPVNAFNSEGYDPSPCIKYLRTNMTSSCMADGCGARQACPVGQGYHYKSDQASFHQHQFLLSSTNL